MDDRAAITELLFRYARGVDRIDIPLIKSTYWPGAIDDHGVFVGTGHDFADHIAEPLTHFASTQHSITNVSIELDGTRARSECYISVTHVVPRRGEDLLFRMGGRYLDRFEKRGAEWRNAARLLLLDWLELPPGNDEIRAHFAKIRRGARAPDDAWHRGEPALA